GALTPAAAAQQSVSHMKLTVPISIGLVAASCTLTAKLSNPSSSAELPKTDEGFTSVCPSCGTPIPSGAVRCTACAEGSQQPAPPAPTTRSPYSSADLHRQELSIKPASSEELH